MCESSAYIIREEGLEKVMENVINMLPEDGKVYLTDLLGEQK